MNKPTIAHMHIFKCAGTTFSWILERCFKGEVLYIESIDPSQRLSWQKVIDAPFLGGSTRAITSHLIDLAEYKSLAEVTVSLVRNPIDRLYSAFLFARDKQGKFSSSTTFKDYVEHHRNSIVSNFMTRHLSPQSWNAPFKGRNGWELRLDLIDLSRDDCFVGSVERFDESMVLLEYLLEQSGHILDLSYPSKLNSTKHGERKEADVRALQASSTWLEPVIEVDRFLIEKVNKALDSKIQQCAGFTSRLDSYKERCRDLANNMELTSAIKVKPVDEWIYME